MKSIICGAGKMGVAIGYAMKILGYEVSIVESNPRSISKFFEKNGECKFYTNCNEIEGSADVFISALPYHATYEASLWAINNKIPYCDLGGSVPVSESIKNVALKKASAPVMTDLGLAPGWINIIAEEVYQLMPDADSIEMMVGGIPQKKVDSDPLNYVMTWSFDGLINEYIDDCIILENGENKFVPGMSGVEDVLINGLELEAFYTSGASAHSIDLMKSRGIKNCVYKTLRWRGHAKLMNYLIKSLDRNNLHKMLNYSTEMHLEGMESFPKDMIVMQVKAKRGNVEISKSTKIVPDKGFSAMQIATAFPISAAADVIAKNKWNTVYFSYNDLPQVKFRDSLNKLLF